MEAVDQYKRIMIRQADVSSYVLCPCTDLFFSFIKPWKNSFLKLSIFQVCVDILPLFLLRLNQFTLFLHLTVLLQ